MKHVPMTSWGDEIQHGVDAVVPEAGVTLDTGLFGQNIVILSLEITDNLREAMHTTLANAILCIGAMGGLSRT
jgi:hypothetical protein